MKLIIASDIHGSLKYTKLLEKIIIHENPDKIILLGDLYYHGPRNPLPEEYNCMGVAEILNKYSDKIIAVQGNCDAEVDQMISNFKINQNSIELNVNNNKFILSHGHHLNEQTLSNNYIYLVGHTHIYNLDNNIINPGSISLPKENKEHTCLLYQDNTFILIDITNNNKIKIRSLDE